VREFGCASSCAAAADDDASVGGFGSRAALIDKYVYVACLDPTVRQPFQLRAPNTVIGSRVFVRDIHIKLQRAGISSDQCLDLQFGSLKFNVRRQMGGLMGVAFLP